MFDEFFINELVNMNCKSGDFPTGWFYAGERTLMVAFKEANRDYAITFREAIGDYMMAVRESCIERPELLLPVR